MDFVFFFFLFLFGRYPHIHRLSHATITADPFRPFLLPLSQSYTIYNTIPLYRPFARDFYYFPRDMQSPLPFFFFILLYLSRFLFDLSPSWFLLLDFIHPVFALNSDKSYRRNLLLFPSFSQVYIHIHTSVSIVIRSDHVLASYTSDKNIRDYHDIEKTNTRAGVFFFFFFFLFLDLNVTLANAYDVSVEINSRHRHVYVVLNYKIKYQGTFNDIIKHFCDTLMVLIIFIIHF